MIFNRKKQNTKNISINSFGFIINIVITALILFIFFGNILLSPNNVFFSKGGDGLQSNFNSYYNLVHDSTYMHSNSMNYPYGESVFFTGGQPIIIITLKAIKALGFDLSSQLIGIINIWMLFSIVFASIFIYLLLIELKLPWHYSIVVSNIIVFLSPQIERFTGHFNLAYVYFLPLFLYLLKRFYNKPLYKISIVIGILSLVALATHAYFFALYGFWIFFLLLYGFLYEKEKFGKVSHILVHLAIQIIIPYFIFSLLTFSYPSDRSTYPWGFFMTRSFPEAVFLPLGKPYGSLFHFSYIKWEGIAYIGLVASITTLVLIINFFKTRKRTSKISLQKLLDVTDNSFLNAVLLGSVIALFLSFAYPFQWQMQNLLNYTGPFRQFRASGRFNWLFFYCINIIAFYLIWNFYKRKKTILSTIIISLAIIWGCYDAYLNLKNKENRLNNKQVYLEDVNNKLPQNKWINSLNTDDYQAILALPFYHVGSEVYWIYNSNSIMTMAYIISWKTGLPIMDVLLSRTSISQTIKSLGLYFEPLQEFQIINDFPNKKNLLLLVAKNDSLNENEKRFIEYALPIENNENYNVYSLPIDSILALNSDFRNETWQETTLFTNNKKNDFFNSCYNSTYIYKSFNNNMPNNDHTNAYLSVDAKSWNTLIDTVLFSNVELVKISFWMKDLNKDLIPRSTLKMESRKLNENFESQLTSSVFHLVKYIGNDGWGLVEFEYQPTESNEQIRITIFNDLITGGHLQFNDILIREAKNNIYYSGEHFIYKNNRYINIP